jgi:hypothetical protein
VWLISPSLCSFIVGIVSSSTLHRFWHHGDLGVCALLRLLLPRLRSEPLYSFRNRKLNLFFFFLFIQACKVDDKGVLSCHETRKADYDDSIDVIIKEQ